MTVAQVAARGAGNRFTACWLLAAICLLGRNGCGQQAQAEEVAWFRVTDMDGEFRSRYLYDRVHNRNSGNGGASEQTQLDRRQEIDMRLSSYIYHPNLITLELAGGPVLQTSAFDQGQFSRDKSQVDLAFGVHATILREKPYRGTLFFDRSHPTLQVGVGETATTDNQRYGGGFDLLSPFTPVPLHFDASRQQIDTNGSLRSSNENIDRINIRASKRLGGYGSTTLRLHATTQDTRSRNPGLASQKSRFDDQSLNLDTRLQFGQDQRYDLVNSIVFLNQRVNLSLGDIPDRKQRRISFNFRGRHDDSLRSFAGLIHDSDDRGRLKRRFDRLNAGATYHPLPNWWFTTGSQLERNRSRQLDNDRYGADGSVRYLRKLPMGTATFHYAMSHERRSQKQNDANLEVIGEQLTLNGVTAVAISQPRVVTGSIRVSNLSRTREFVEGIDYEIIVVGIETRLRRLSGGTILQNEQLLVDYVVAIGGSFRSSETDQSFGVVWQITPHLEFQYQGNLSTPKVLSGDPTFALNKVRSHLYIVRGDWPVPGTRDLRLGGRGEYEDRHETIESFTRNSLEAFAQTSVPLLRAATIRMGVRRTQVTHDDSTGDSNLRSFDLNLISRHRFNGTVSLDGSYEQDVGGPSHQTRLVTAIRARARYRRIIVTGEIVHSSDQQGPFRRDRSHVLFELRREFF